MVRLLPCGERAALLECADLAEALDRHDLVWNRERPEGLVDAVPGARTLLLVAQDRAVLDRAVRVATRELSPSDRPVAPPRRDDVVELPVRYDGPDLDAVAELTGLTPEDVVAAHTARPWTVGFGGFAPGFAYLADGDPRLEVPRRREPRPRVEAGSVGLAGRFCGVYPRTSPGGWQLIGRTDAVLWDLEADPPALVRPGMRVQFIDVTGAGAASEPSRLVDSAPEDAADRSPSRALEVVDAGPLTLVQDLGRPGLAAMGVGRSGAADRGAHALGARLLGQEAVLASLECHLGGLVVRAREATTIVLTGAPCPAWVDGVPVGHLAPFTVAAGGVLRLGAPATGLRTYVSVSGGVDVPPVLGSRSHDTLSDLGPGRLSPGQVVPVGAPRGRPTVDVAPLAHPTGEEIVLSATPGPRLDWLADAGDLAAAPWTVAPDSDRVGVRLRGRALRRRASLETAELPSEGVVRGGVQVPADGQPVVFLADHPVTGGYPVVAVLDDGSVDRLAQVVPGQVVRIRLTRG